MSTAALDPVLDWDSLNSETQDEADGRVYDPNGQMPLRVFWRKFLIPPPKCSFASRQRHGSW